MRSAGYRRKRREQRCVLAALLVLLGCGGFDAAAHAQAAARDPLRERVEQLLFTGWPQIDGAAIANPKQLAEFYSRRDFEPAWTLADASKWLDWLGRIDGEGLRPQDYYFEQLRRLRESGTDPRATASFDVLLTASWLRATHDLRFGRVDPTSLETTWNLELAPPSGWDPVQMLEAGLRARSLERFFEERLPKPRLYDELKDALRQYREIAARGGWPLVPDGPTLRLLDAGQRVAILRQRLAVTGDYPGSVPAELAATFEPQLETAVRRIQQRHGLDADGVVGRATLAAINVPVATRIDQLRLNLERGRWVFGDLSDRFLVVNIASFQVFLVENDRPVWTARTQVGRYYRQTPIFRGELEYLVLNPTWTVPPTILREDIVPRAKADPAYLQRMDIDVLTAEGRPVDVSTLDWTRLTPANFPYLLQQRAGPENLLGSVKFIFPNPHFVFLHDTPNRALFDAAERTFSSGCIRVEDAVRLAELVLDDRDEWSYGQLEQAIATNETRTVQLRNPLPVLVLYWTASVDAQGLVRFLPDVYRRDARVLAALDAPSGAAQAAPY